MSQIHSPEFKHTAKNGKRLQNVIALLKSKNYNHFKDLYLNAVSHYKERNDMMISCVITTIGKSNSLKS